MKSHQPDAIVEEDVLVEHRTFLLLDPDNNDWRDDPGPHPRDIATATRHVLWLHSAGNDHYAHVRVELWSTPPPHDPTWETHTTTTLHLTGHRLCLATTINGPILHLPGPDNPDLTEPTIHYLELPTETHYTVHILVNGRAETTRLHEATWQHHVESWCIRLWPTHTHHHEPPGGITK